MNKIKRSICLFKTSLTILFREKKLLLFPFIASGLALVVALFFFAPVALYPTGHSYLSAAHWTAIGDRISQAGLAPAHSPGHSASIGVNAGLAGGGYLLF